MAVPGSNPVQFNPPGGQFYVDSVTDPNDAPANVLDLDLGFKISGRLTMPNWLEGTGQVCVYVQEIGGPVNQSIGCTKIALKRATPPAEPALTTYKWSVEIPKNSHVLPDPQRGSSQVYNMIAVFVFDDQLTDIGAFVEMGTYMIN